MELQVGEKASRINDLEVQISEHQSKRQRTQDMVQARPP